MAVAVAGRSGLAGAFPAPPRCSSWKQKPRCEDGVLSGCLLCQ